MYKFSEISISAIIVLVLVVMAFYYISNQTNEIDRLNNLDFNDDGVVTRKELKYYLSMVHASNQKKKIKREELVRSSISGMIRGFLTGLLLSDIHGGIALGTVLSVINPMIMGTEKIIDI